jgi:glutathione S-transferase
MGDLTLMVLPAAFGMCNSSTFCEKAEALLAYTGLPYEREIAMPNKGPRGKLPVLKDGNRVIPDSSHIQTYLETQYKIDFDGALNEEQRADAQAFRRLGEEHLILIRNRTCHNIASGIRSTSWPDPQAVRMS